MRPTCVEECCKTPAKHGNKGVDGRQLYKKRCSHHHALFYESPEAKIRRYKKRDLRRYPYKAYKADLCEFCGFVPEHSCQLDVDHIDGNNKNNDTSNLQTLCANCHRLKTFKNNDWAKVA